MKFAQQVPRNALVWIILSQFVLVAPHLGRLPVWVLAVYVSCAVWRFQVYRGQWSLPGRWVKLLLILVGCAGIYLSYGSLLGLEPTVALLLTAFALKLLELVRRQDAYVVLFLGYFICITEFLFSQDLLVVLYSLLAVLLVTTALVALHQPGENRLRLRSLRTAGVMLAQAFPLMLVLFFLFPRIGPLWTVPLKSHAAKTGVSDFMSPGDISRLSQSDEVAFRVQFDGEIPPRSQLYWRGLVFSRLEGDTWSSLQYYDVPSSERRPPGISPPGDPLRYTVLMRPTQQNWLYGLHYAESRQGGVMQAPDFRLFRPVEIEDQYRYRARSWLGFTVEPELSDWRRRTELKLPPERNPRTRALALQMREEAASDARFVDAVLDMFNQQPYVYTLQPPLLGPNGMDDFLFRTRRGFCEHYAHAFTVMMRAAGVPARVVAGYQGGEVNPVNRTVIVHQFDAHAWTEVWLPGEGWRRVDPTAAVSPARVEQGLEQAVAEEGSFLSESPLSPLRYRGINWVNSLRLQYDALTYRWQSWIVGFDGDQQLQLLQDWFGRLDARKFLLLLFGSWALVLLPVALWLLWRRPRQALSQVDRAYLACCERLARCGVPRQEGEAPGVYARRAADALPNYAAVIDSIHRAYEGYSYAPVPAVDARDCARQIRRLRRRLPSG